MVALATEPDLQTMTAVGKVSVTDDSTALLLGLLGFSATKLWNTAVWHTREVWKTTGKIPSYAKMDVAV
jgi:putative transposase